MRISPRRLPRLLGVAVVAFAQYEDRPLLGAVELFRGLSIQMTYRWACNCMLADRNDRAVLLWTEVFRVDRRPIARQLAGALMATTVGIVMVAITSAMALIPLSAVLLFFGVGARVVTAIGLSFVILRWLVTCWSAFRAYRNERVLAALLPAPSSLRWRIDYLAAIPARNGYGGHLLERFLDHADDRGAEVVLHCDRQNVNFYGRYGFRETAVNRPGMQRVMLRRVPSGSRPRRADVHQKFVSSRPTRRPPPRPRRPPRPMGRRPARHP